MKYTDRDTPRLRYLSVYNPCVTKEECVSSILKCVENSSIYYKIHNYKAYLEDEQRDKFYDIINGKMGGWYAKLPIRPQLGVPDGYPTNYTSVYEWLLSGNELLMRETREIRAIQLMSITHEEFKEYLQLKSQKSVLTTHMVLLFYPIWKAYDLPYSHKPPTSLTTPP